GTSAFSRVIITPAPKTDLILDNTNAEVNFTGTWSTGTTAIGRYGADYRFVLGTNASSPASIATYRPFIPTNGFYDVFIYYAQGSNRSTNAPWQITWNGGSLMTNVNQTVNGGSW